MSRRVVVRGDDVALAELSAWLNGPVRLIEDRDGWAITTPEIDAAPSPTEARNAAASIVAELSGLARLHLGRTVALRAGQVADEDSEEGRRDVFVFPEPAIGYAFVGTPRVLVDDVTPSRPENIVERGMRLRKDPLVHLVLALLAEAPSWSSLYKVLDAIEEDVGGERALEAKRWVPASDLRHFTQNANAIENAASGGRHARSAYRLSRATRAMPLDRAVEVIIRLVELWLADKA